MVIRKIEISILPAHPDYPMGQIIAREKTNGENARIFEGRNTGEDIEALSDALKRALKTTD